MRSGKGFAFGYAVAMPFIFWLIWFVCVVLLCWRHMDLPGTGIIWVALGIVANVLLAILVVAGTRSGGVIADSHGKAWGLMIMSLVVGGAISLFRGGVTRLRWGAAAAE